MAFFLCLRLDFGPIVWVIRFTCTLQHAEVTGNIPEELTLSIDNIVVCTIGMIQNDKFLPIAMRDLVQ